jgi:hypothetical protein
MGRIGGVKQFRHLILRGRFRRRALFIKPKFEVPHHFGNHGDTAFQLALTIEYRQPDGVHQQKIGSRTPRPNDRQDERQISPMQCHVPVL